MKLLAIDYGSKRIGLAVGDTENKIAFPRGILENSPRILDAIKDFCKKESIGKIIVGLPLSLSGQDSVQTKEIRMFVERLQKQITVPIELIDERLTSTQAHKLHPEKKKIDDIAASLLLEQYLAKK